MGLVCEVMAAKRAGFRMALPSFLAVALCCLLAGLSSVRAFYLPGVAPEDFVKVVHLFLHCCSPLNYLENKVCLLTFAYP